MSAQAIFTLLPQEGEVKQLRQVGTNQVSARTKEAVIETDVRDNRQEQFCIIL